MNKFKVTIKARHLYRLGSPLKITVTLKNLTGKDYYILLRNTAFDSIHSDCFTITCDKQAVEYDSLKVKWAELSEKSFCLLPAGQKKSVTISLAERYLFTHGGKTTLWYHPRLVYTQHLEDFKQEMRTTELSVIVKNFHILEGRNIYPTKGLHAQFRQKNELGEHIKTIKMYANEEYASPQIIFHEEKHPNESKNFFTNLVTEGHYAMINYLIHTINELDPKYFPTNLHYKMVFGDADNIAKTEENYEAIRKAMQQEQIYERNDDPDMEDDTYAYVIGTNPTVYLCKLYTESPLSGTDSRLGILLHELSHIYAQTDDVEIDKVSYYGRRLCRKLAIEHPDLAITNADSYEFFTESKFLNWMEEKQWTGCNDIDPTAYGGPSVVMLDNQLCLFYKSKDGNLKTSTYDGSTFTAPVNMMTTESQPIPSEFQPEAVLFKDQLYVFYISKEEKTLCYTICQGEKWSEGVPAIPPSGNKLKPLYTPQPAVYQKNLVFIYLKEKDGGMYMTSFDGSQWKEETDVPNTTSLVKEIVYNPAVAVYAGTLYAIYLCKGSNQINYACYHPDKDTWNMNNTILIRAASGSSTAVYAESSSEIRAVMAADMLHLLFTDAIGRLWQIQMSTSFESPKKGIVFTDLEPVLGSTTNNYNPQAFSLCSCTCNKDYGYLVYRGKNGEIYMSIQMPALL